MLNFDEERFLRIQSGAVSLADEIDRIVRNTLTADVGNLFFLGAGGAGILMRPAAELLLACSGIPTRVANPSELVLVGSPALGARTISVIPSLSGTTPESLAALEYCRSRGAKVLTLTGHAETPIARNADYNLTNFAEDDTSSESFFLQSLLVALSVLRLRGEIADYDEVVAQLRQLPPLLVDAKRNFDSRAEELAQQLRANNYHIMTSAGPSWAEAWYYGMCILEEMQWIRTRPVHASDFFHGTLELVEEGVSVIALKGEDAARPLVERVADFAYSYTDRLTVIDTADVSMPGITARVRALISPVIFATLLERLSAHLEVQRNHPLITRRYYRKVAY